MKVSTFQFFSFRITKVFNAPIDLTHTAGTTLPIPHFIGSITPFADLSKMKINIDGIDVEITEYIPNPYRRWDEMERTKSTMKTVRILLSQFVGINLSAINNISFEFDTTSGLVMLDDIEFIN